MYIKATLFQNYLKSKLMNSHYQLTDQEFTSAFKSKKLNSKLFTHEAHLRLAWIYINQYGLETAEVLLCKQIKAYATSQGADDKFNTTITVAATKAVYHFMNRSKAITFNELIDEFPRLKTKFKSLMATHYGLDIFNNLKAKASYLSPDLVSF